MNFDTVLVYEAQADKRVKIGGKVTAPVIIPWYNMDPNSLLAYGSMVRSALSSLGQGYSVKVSDFGSDIVVEVTHHDQRTSRSASRTYLIKMNDKNGKGWVKSTSNRFRTITSIDLATSYIRSSASSLRNLTAAENV